MSSRDQIRLQLPARPEYGRVARIAAAQLALRVGFSLHEIDDLRLVMDEAATLMVGAGDRSSTLTFDYETHETGIAIDMRIEVDDTDDDAPPDHPLPDDRIGQFTTAVGDLVDEFSIDPIGRRLTIAKSRNAFAEEPPAA